jgi:dolichol-phosphate mannosyltransferase
MKVLATAPVFNEELKIGNVVSRVPRDVVDEVLIVDDGSTDRSPDIARNLGATVLPLGRTIGVGAAIRAAFEYALNKGYDVVVVMAGNNKDAPEEIPLLLDPIAEDRADFVQGSRFLKRSTDFGDMPAYRRLATRAHPVLFSLVAGRRVSESTNGFRSIRTSVLRDERIDLKKDWLDGYELEPFLYLRVIRLGYRTTEVPVTKLYPPKKLGQTKMKPITGWWQMLRPLAYVATGRWRRAT